MAGEPMTWNVTFAGSTGWAKYIQSAHPGKFQIFAWKGPQWEPWRKIWRNTPQRFRTWATATAARRNNQERFLGPTTYGRMTEDACNGEMNHLRRDLEGDMAWCRRRAFSPYEALGKAAIFTTDFKSCYFVPTRWLVFGVYSLTWFSIYLSIYLSKWFGRLNLYKWD